AAGAAGAGAAAAAAAAVLAPPAIALLWSGAPRATPALQPPCPLTADALATQDYSAVAHRAVLTVLSCDMHAFRRANPGAVFADFVRWYRPSYWRPSAAGGGAGADDPLRTSWPGEGSVEWPVSSAGSSSNTGGPDGSNAGGGGGSSGCSSGELDVTQWMCAWLEAADAPAPPREAFCEAKEAEKALHALETISVAPLAAQLLHAYLGSAAYWLAHAPSRAARALPAAAAALDAATTKVDAASAALAAVAAAKLRRAVAARWSPGAEVAAAGGAAAAALVACQEACAAFAVAERVLARAEAAASAFPGAPSLADRLVSAGNDAVVTIADGGREKLAAVALLVDGGFDGGSRVNDGAGTSPECWRRRLPQGQSAAVVLPPAAKREYVLRCVGLPHSFHAPNVGRRPLLAYPTPPARMFAVTDGEALRVALSLPESEL
ncbi:unnamed protein product, partial [Phaeothamnion confervicola]